MDDREKLQFRWYKGLCKEISGQDVVGFFLSHRTPKIPWSLNKPLQALWLTSDYFLLHHDQLYELSFSCQACFFFMMWSSFILLKASRQDLSHIANDLPMSKQFHFPRQTFFGQLQNLIPPPHKVTLSQSWSKVSKVSSTRVVSSPVNRTRRFLSCFHLANDTLNQSI